MPPVPLVSVAIPCYEMHGRGAEFLEVALKQLALQTYPAIEVVVADHSADDAVELICRNWAPRLTLQYVRNAEKRGSSSANANAAIRHARGQLVKVLCQDDHLRDQSAIEKTVAAFGSRQAWLVSGYLHCRDGELVGTHIPQLNRDLAFVNTIGTHSCLTIRNSPDQELFDEGLIWLMDCEYYRRLYDRFGPPAILTDPTVVQVLWEGQVTHTHAAPRSIRRAELQRVRRKHPKPIADLPAVGTPLSRLLRKF